MGNDQSFTAVYMETPDGRICAYVRGVLNTTVYGATVEECHAKLKGAVRVSLERTYQESLAAFSGLGLRYVGTFPPGLMK